VLLLLSAGQSRAEEPRVYTNESYLDDTMRKSDLRIDDVKSVFRLVFGSLPERVKVYPTENYYYFYFYHGGVKYAGNFRFDIEDRDRGLVHFNYFKDFSLWQRDETDYSALYGAKDGIEVKKTANLVYDVSFEGKTVRFELNDLSGVKPSEGAVRPDETYLGPIFDESGIRFFLVFHPKLKIFLFVLDETVANPDQFVQSAASKRVTIGVRTGFAFYADDYSSRKILIGVNQINTAVNNYFDGPFDQLPDNFIKGNALHDAIIAASPEMRGHIDRLGNSPSGETRYLIAPYLQYTDAEELGIIDQCTKEEKPPIYYNCFSFIGFDQGANEDQH
ncbi:MAG: hypothetical protein ACJ8AS_01845, partial [Hyphomicrobiales bacterium]